MVKLTEVSENILKSVGYLLEKKTCYTCESKFNGESELEWNWKTKSPNNLNIKVRCMKCGKISKNSLKV